MTTRTYVFQRPTIVSVTVDAENEADARAKAIETCDRFAQVYYSYEPNARIVINMEHNDTLDLVDAWEQTT